ncbi:N5-glutamine methyltransferase family protein [Raineyella fluvialis]|uniref:peptide chain release factor N(5)-glutamine methyltransferase n=1 Tax=Raineyella fluvialis TaxID=2662261 RepID=A0A5Q2FB67_9ACTN|nr:HemK/PrmC family methyltransferase [Raineyella fluvialis]QGF24039.1 HemK family protein methyltransferase [Raineyella fluvialis]
MDFAPSSGLTRRLLDTLRRSGSVFPQDELAALVAAASGSSELTELVDRRADGVPVEVLVGYAWFGDLRIRVTSGVFIPRHRTEYLVERALRHLSPGDRLLDLGCGSGAVAALVAHHVGALDITAMDIDPVAVGCARINLPPPARVVLADSPAALAPERFHVIVANLPYVPTARLPYLPRDARDYEPLVALDGGWDGLDPLRRVAPHLLSRLLPDGWFLVEVGEDQTEPAAAILRGVGFAAVAVSVSNDRDTNVVEARR